MYKNSIRNIVMPLALAAAIVVGILIGVTVGRNNSSALRTRGTTVDASNKISYAVSLIENLYVDSVNLDSLAEKVLPNLFSELDPHSVYIPALELADVSETLEGEFDGIGVMFNMATDTVIVLNVISSGPSDKAGVQNGDRIIKINDSIVAGRKMDQNSVVKMLRGKRGTKVKLSLQRHGIKDLVPITVERGIIPIKSLDASFMITPEVGFIKLTTFSKKSYSELLKAINELKKQGMKGLIFDLRGNTGGFLDQAISIANEFLPKDNLIVYTEDRHKKQVKEYSDGTGSLLDVKLAILIDEGSASSSEILAGAIQDNDRGIVIGRRSYGKGLVQQQIPFTDGSVVRLTIARYFTPTGRSIQKPYVKGKGADYADDIINRYNHNEFFVMDSIKFADSLKFTTPGGKIVYGGGGIMPDIFMPMDTSDVTKYYIEVTGRNILYRYTLEYSDKHRDKLNGIKTVKELDALFNNDKTLFDNFVKFATSNGVAPNYNQIATSRKIMEAQIRSYIGRNTQLQDIGFYSNIYKIDNTIKRAIDEVSKQ